MRSNQISQIFWTSDGEYAFQRVGDYWNLYKGKEGKFLKEFRSFWGMEEFIQHEQRADGCQAESDQEV